MASAANTKLQSSNIDRKYFHPASDQALFDKIDETLYEHLHGECNGMPIPPSVFAFAMGSVHEEASYPHGELEHRFRTSGGKWLHGDIFPTSASWFMSESFFGPEDELLVAAMHCTHDGVCDEPAMATLFFEGGLAGDVENLLVIMVYDHYGNVFKELDELGVLFLSEDSAYHASNGFPSYFGARNLASTHDSADGQIRVQATMPIPLFEEFPLGEIAAAYELSVIMSLLPSLKPAAMFPLPLGTTLKCLKGALFSNGKVFGEAPADIFEALDELASPGKGTRPMIFRKRKELVDVMLSVEPLCYDGVPGLNLRKCLDNEIKKQIHPLRDFMSKHHIEFEGHMLDFASTEDALMAKCESIRELNELAKTNNIPGRDIDSDIGKAAHES